MGTHYIVIDTPQDLCNNGVQSTTEDSIMCSVNVQIMEVEEKIASAIDNNSPQAEIELLKQELIALEARNKDEDVLDKYKWLGI